MDGAPLFFCGVHVAQSLVFYVVFCRSFFVLFLLAIPILFMAFDYPFDIFKLFSLLCLWQGELKIEKKIQQTSNL
jgi:hypothetical protein